LAGALVAALEECARAEAERAHVLALAAELARRLGRPAPAGAIVPVPAGSPERALELAQRLAARGLWVPAVRPPTVPENGSRLRVVCHAHNTASELDELARALAHAALPAPPPTRIEAEPAGRPLFVVGTDTDVGKTVVSALLLRAALRLGRAAYWKPVQTGPDDDSATVRALAEAPAHAALPKAWHLPLPASPHEAAAQAGKSIDPRAIAQGLDGLLRTLRGTRVVVELAGGLLVPYRLEPALATQADWLAELRPPLVLVARAGLGTLNHTLLTLEALRARQLEPRALFLVGEPHASNRATLARVAGLACILELPHFEALSPAALDGWLEHNDLAGVLA
ncbi:MAG: dethiobiotin synthase, partial [Planctomycetota bacterium]